MDYKDFIKPGEKVIHFPEDMGYDLWMYEPEVVTIGKYSPYFTDGTPDPSPEEYDESCFVEIEGETSWGESQLSLGSLYNIVSRDEEVVYKGDVVKLFGHDEDNEFSVIVIDGKYKVVFSEDIEERKNIKQLSFDELQKLREQICGGSIYLSDYNNTLGVPSQEVSDAYDEFQQGLYEQFGLEWQNFDTPVCFAEYFSA